jgi:hypothetical protein
MPQGQDVGTVGATKKPPWEAFGEKYGLSPEESYVIWQKAEQTSNGSLADTAKLAVQAMSTAQNEAGPPSAPPGGPSSTSGGGSSGGGISAADRAKQIAGAEASFASMVRAWGIELSPRLQNLVSQAARSGWNSAQFTQALRGTKEYHMQFPGIQWKRGMSEATYNSMYNQYRQKAQDASYNLSRAAFSHALKKGIDSAEWSLRVSSIKQIEANRPLLENFRQELISRGIMKPSEKLPPQELYKFATGRGSQLWSAVWNEASVETGLEGIGVTVGKGGGADITRKELSALLKGPISKLDPGSTVDVDYANLAATMAKALPASQLYRAGLTKKMLVQEALGDPKAAGVRDTITRVLATGVERFNESTQAQSPRMAPGGGTQAGSAAPQATE